MSDERITSIELLEANHRFPGTFMFKVIGHARDGFIARVMLAVREELSLSIDPPFTLRQSAGGKYVSVTLEPFLMTSQEVLDVYRKFATIEGVVTYC